MFGEAFYRSIVELTRDHVIAIIAVATAAHSPHVIVHGARYLRHHGARHVKSSYAHACHFCSAAKASYRAFCQYYKDAAL